MDKNINCINCIYKDLCEKEYDCNNCDVFYNEEFDQWKRYSFYANVVRENEIVYEEITKEFE